MSYFGTQGPPQDSGFIGGIARGQARLRNAQANRARYSKGLGARKAIDFGAYRFIPGASDYPEDSILYKRTKNFVDSYPNVRDTKIAVADGRLSKEMADPLIQQYEKDKQLIAEWAESGPYVLETKAFQLGIAPILLGVAIYGGYKYLNRPRSTPTKAHKGALSAVFA
tara:strand:+ start:127 stop:630 length:504 start_codon:yes stop_codon:yes gene_type:complete